MADLEDLKFYYPGKKLVADGGVLTEYVADSGTTTTLVDAALTEADDFWTGGIILFLGGTPTAALRGHTAHISDFDAASDTLTIAKALPASVATGEQYILIMGGNFRSTTELLAQRASGQFPELVNLPLSNITGVTLKYASPGLQALTVTWVQGSSELDIGGVAYNVVGDASDVLIFDATIGGWIVIDVIQASLPGSNQSDIITLSRQTQTFVPDVEGYESENALKGKTRYRLQVVKNEAGDTMNSLVVGFPSQSGNEVALAPAQSVDLSAGSFDLVDGSGLPSGGFFLYNETLDDARYIQTRSGNTLTMAATNKWTKINVSANNTTEPFPGDTVTTISGSGIIDAIRLTSGSWAGGDAVAIMYIKDLTGSMLNTEQLQISAVNIALLTSNDVKGIRDKTGATWTVEADIIMLMPAVDIALQAPSANQFADPASETLYPDEALAFSAPIDIFGFPLLIGSLTAGSIYGVWIREWIMDGMKANAEEIDDLEYSWS